MFFTDHYTYQKCHYVSQKQQTSSSKKCSKCPQQQLSKPARRPHRTSSVASTFNADRRERTSVTVSQTESRSDWAELAEMQYRPTRRTTSDSCMLSPELEWSVVGSWDLHGLVACKVISTRQQNSACWLVCGWRCSISEVGSFRCQSDRPWYQI